MKGLKCIMIIVFGGLILAGCNTLGVGVQGPSAQPARKAYHKPGPPPHAPAHGYRHKQQDGHELVYDSGVGAYVVLNIPDTYFGNNMYIRMSTDGRWLVSATLDGGWRLAAGNEVPPRLKDSKEKKWKNKKHKNKKNKKYDDD